MILKLWSNTNVQSGAANCFSTGLSRSDYAGLDDVHFRWSESWRNGSAQSRSWHIGNLDTMRREV